MYIPKLIVKKYKFTVHCLRYETVTVHINQNLIQVLPWCELFETPSTRSKKAKARRSREADIISDIKPIDFLRGSVQYNPIERDLDQMTNF